MSDLNRPDDRSGLAEDDAPDPPDGADREVGAPDVETEGRPARVPPDLGALPPPPD